MQAHTSVQCGLIFWLLKLTFQRIKCVLSLTWLLFCMGRMSNTMVPFFPQKMNQGQQWNLWLGGRAFAQHDPSSDFYIHHHKTKQKPNQLGRGTNRLRAWIQTRIQLFQEPSGTCSASPSVALVSERLFYLAVIPHLPKLNGTALLYCLTLE